jgi:RES domain-containing protein
LAGEGARIYGGRWNHKGTPLIYTASAVSLAVVEALVHSDILPKDMVLIAYDVPNAPKARAWPTASLPADWADDPFPPSTQDLGTVWATAGVELAVRAAQSTSSGDG